MGYVLPIALLLLAWQAGPAGPADADGDQLADAAEQRLLERFRPAFHFSRTDCDALPSEFQPGARAPKSTARNGTIYGQAFPVRPAGREGAFIELHYLHLWKQDCGRAGHALDAEHVSALLTAESMAAPAAEWKALYWFAGAHEGTVCDSSNGARAGALDAERKGPHVWVSHGKHASYLSLELCRAKGCGGDRCEDMIEGPAGPPVNLGEWNAPLNGASWVHGGKWKMAPKFQTDFSVEMLARFQKLDEAAAGPVNGSAAPAKVVMLAGGETMGAIQTGGKHTGKALDTADRHTDDALNTAATQTGTAISKSASSVGRSIKKAAKSVGGAIGAK